MLDITGFLLAILPISLSPGASFTLAMSNVAATGRVTACFTIILGTGLGLATHGLLVGLGISNLIAQNEGAMLLLKVVGLLFLLWLAIKLFLGGIRNFKSDKVLPKKISGVVEALSLNVFNAKALLLYLTVVPMFAGTQLTNYLLLSSLHIVVMAVWLVSCSLIIVTANKKIQLHIIESSVSIVGAGFLLFLSVSSAMELLT